MSRLRDCKPILCPFAYDFGHNTPLRSRRYLYIVLSMSSPTPKSALVNAIESYLEEYSWDASLPARPSRAAAAESAEPVVTDYSELPAELINDCALGPIIAFKARG